MIAVAGTLFYILAFACGTGPIPALLSAEVFPAKARGSGIALAMLTHWVANVVIGQFFPMAVEHFGLGVVYLAFGGVCAVGASYIAGPSIPETKGRSLDDIQRHFA